VFAGPDEAVAAMIEACRRGPSAAWVSAVDAGEGRADLLRERRPGERFSVLSTV
jgi:acylphosphatase